MEQNCLLNGITLYALIKSWKIIPVTVKGGGIYTPLPKLHGTQIALLQLEYPMDIPVPRVFLQLGGHKLPTTTHITLLSRPWRHLWSFLHVHFTPQSSLGSSQSMVGGSLANRSRLTLNLMTSKRRNTIPAHTKGKGNDLPAIMSWEWRSSRVLATYRDLS
jgi:hypothetical protein